MIKNQIDADLKTALLSGDKELTTTLRTIKSVILDAEVATGKREEGLDDDSIINILIKESKKRNDSANIYKQAGDNERAKKELAENEVISKYMPKMMSQDEITELAKEVIDSIENPSIQQMGQIIGQVKSKTGPLADGALIAKIVKEFLS